MSKTFLAASDFHIPYQNDLAVEVFVRTAEAFKPDVVLLLGDLLDCSQFSVHPPTMNLPETNYEDDLVAASAMLDRLQACCGHLVMLEGNHEYRIDRWAASTTEGKGAYSMLAPRIQLPKNRKRCTYVRYGMVNGQYPHHHVNHRIVAVHGWSYAQSATRNHLAMSQGKSVIHGHTHRGDSTWRQNIYESSRIVQAHSSMCLCQLVPLYGVGRPVEWVNGFLVGYMGKRSDTILPVQIMGERCILPDGKEVQAGLLEAKV